MTCEATQPPGDLRPELLQVTQGGRFLRPGMRLPAYPAFPPESLSGLAFPFTLTAGQSASFTVTFAPNATGTASGTVSFASNATNTPTVMSLTGTGAPPPQHSVDLSWNASTSVVVGYNVYHGTTSGGPFGKINSALDANTTYTDSTVQAGQTYYYVTTAVDGNGNESTYSNTVVGRDPDAVGRENYIGGEKFTKHDLIIGLRSMRLRASPREATHITATNRSYAHRH
jgi:hypothetical protein